MSDKILIMEAINIFCENTGAQLSVPMGTNLKDIAPSDGKTLAALVDNKLKSLDYKVINPHNVRFIDYSHPDGRRTYIRSLCFVLQKVVHHMYPDKVLAIDYSLPSGLYCEIRERSQMEDGRPQVYFVTDDELSEIQSRMRAVVEADLPFTKEMLPLEEASAMFDARGQHEKARLLRSIGRFHYNVYWLDGLADTFYGPLTTSTGCLTTFDISGFNEGFLLQYPMDGDSGKVLPMKRQSKLAKALDEQAVISFTHDCIVSDILVPVSPSGTGKTFNSSMSARLNSNAFAPPASICLNVAPFILFILPL